MILFMFRFFCMAVFLITVNAYANPKDASKVLGELTLEATESQEEMRRRILTTVESAKRYQDMMDSELKSLKNENKDLHEKLIKLKQQFESVATGVDASLNAQHQKPLGSTQIIPIQDKKSSLSILNKLAVALFDLKIGGAFLLFGLLLFIWFYWGREVTRNVSSVAPLEETIPVKNLTIPVQHMMVPLVSANQEGEYDYIGSIEAIPAKLDLARMYREMGDLASAELILKGIMVQGSDEQFLEASALWEDMKKIS